MNISPPLDYIINARKWKYKYCTFFNNLNRSVYLSVFAFLPFSGQYYVCNNSQNECGCNFGQCDSAYRKFQSANTDYHNVETTYRFLFSFNPWKKTKAVTEIINHCAFLCERRAKGTNTRKEKRKGTRCGSAGCLCKPDCRVLKQK